jgi:hypothetical protein
MTGMKKTLSTLGILFMLALKNPPMPKSGSLPTAQKNSVVCFIDSGVPNN